MSAFFVGCLVPACDMTDERFLAIAAAVEALSESELADAGDAASEYVRDKLADGDAEDGDAEDLGGPDAVRSAIRQALAEYRDCAGRRDVGCVKVAGCRWFVTGGMTHGDAPTRAYGFLGLIACLPSVFETLQLWARRDAELEAANERKPADPPN